MNQLRLRALTTISAVSATGISAMAFHSGAWGVVATGAAGLIAWHCGEDALSSSVKSMVMHNEIQAAERFVEQIMPEPEVLHEDQRALSKLKRLVGISSIADARSCIVPPGVAHDTEPSIQSHTEEWNGLPLPSKQNGVFTFSQVIEQGFTPSLSKIYLGTHEDGTHVYCPTDQLYHIALSGKSGGGKGNLMRLLMLQLCKAGAQVLLLNPHYTDIDRENGDDWRPYKKHLLKEPIYEESECVQHLLWACTLMTQRKTLYRAGKPLGKPVFLVVDEWPSIVKCEGAAEALGTLLREARKFKIYVILSSQDFQVKTLGLDKLGGSVRGSFNTCFYTGGDPVSICALLGLSARDNIPVPEGELGGKGKGKAMLKCSSLDVPKAVKVPLVDNETLYRMLGRPQDSQSTRHLVPDDALEDCNEQSSDVRSIIREELLKITAKLSAVPQSDSQPCTPKIELKSSAFEQEQNTEQQDGTLENDEIARSIAAVLGIEGTARNAAVAFVKALDVYEATKSVRAVQRAFEIPEGGRNAVKLKALLDAIKYE